MNGLDPAGAAARRHRDQAADRRPGARARLRSPRRRQRVVPAAAPEPTPTRLGAADVQSVAAANGVSPSLAAAIAWQESGFNNGMVSARQRARRHAGDAGHVGLRAAQPRRPPARPELGDRQRHAPACSTSSTCSQQTGGDENAAIAGYYQGLGSVRSRGVFDDTQQYVANVQALRSRFGG